MRIVKMRLRSADQWQEFVSGEKLFVPSTVEVKAGEEMIVEVGSAKLPNVVLIKGTVVSWQAALPRARVRAGAKIAIASGEAAKVAFVSSMLASEATTVARRKFPRLPVQIPARIRRKGSTENLPVNVVELSAGGVLLTGIDPLALGTEFVLEIAAPRAAAPLMLAAKASYLGAGLSTGCQFVVKDAHGRKQISELVRRFREA